MKKWKYILGLFMLWLLFTALGLLALFQFVLSYGKVEVTLDYTTFEKETVSVYWNKGAAWGIENCLSQTSSPGRHQYSFNIRHADSITAFRVYADEASDSVILHSVAVNGIRCPLQVDEFSNNDHNNVRIEPTATGLKIYRDLDSENPNVEIPVPPSCHSVLFNWKPLDIVYMLLLLLFDIFLLVICIRKKFLKTFFCQNNNIKIFFVVAFLLCLSMVWSNRLLNFYPYQPNIENRKLIKRPQWGLLPNHPDSFFTSTTQWCSDYFMYRNLLINARSTLYVQWLKQSPVPNTVMIGKDNMFFQSFKWFTNDFMGKMRYAQVRIDSISRITEEKQEILSRNGIPFFLVLIPAKQTVYYDYMPEYYRVQQARPTLLDQVVQDLGKHQVSFVSLADTMIALRETYPNKPLFYDFDTHWNEFGAFKAYQSVMNALFLFDSAYGRPLRDQEITIDTLQDNLGDLAKCLIVNNRYQRTIYKIQPIIRDSISQQKVLEKDHGATYIYTNPKGHGRALFFRDSYMVQWAPYFAHHFKECILIWDHAMYMDEIMKYQPDIVIEEVGEFYIHHLLIPLKPKPEHVKKKD
jgi:hypothetical protein